MPHRPHLAGISALVFFASTATAHAHGGHLDPSEVAEIFSPADQAARTGQDPDAAKPETGSHSGKDPCKSDPSTTALILTGLGVTPLVYVAGVAWHEGSHAGMVTALGGKVEALQLFPSTMSDGHTYFGKTTWNANFTNTQKALTYIAPKITDSTILIGYSLMLETGSMPENKYAQLALTAVAIGALVDFSKDALDYHPGDDVPMFYRSSGIQDSALTRSVHIGLAALGGIEVSKGLIQLFSSSPAPSGAPRPKQARDSDFSVRPYVSGETIGLHGTF